MKLLFVGNAAGRGLGHHHRALALAREASCRGHEALFLSDVESHAAGVRWERNDPRGPGPFRAWARTFRPDWVVADLPERLPPSWLQNGDWRLCLVDGDPAECDLAVGQGFGGHEHEAPEHVILSPEIRTVRRRRHRDGQTCWFVWGGAADLTGLLLQFDRHVDDWAVLMVVDGLTPWPSNHKNDHEVVRTPQRSGFLGMMADCDRAALQMGVTVWEALFFRLPCFVTSYDDRGLATALALRDRGWVKAWPVRGLPPGPQVFRNFYSQPFDGPREEVVDGHGAARVVALLEARK